MNKQFTTSDGFTLIELMIAIAIMGVLSALVSGQFVTSLIKGRDTQRKEDLHQIQTALEMYYEDNKVYPTSLPWTREFCASDPCQTGNKKYMLKIPNDPINKSNTSIKYNYVSNGAEYQLYTCLENNQITPMPITPPAGGCSPKCGNPPTTSCNYGVSSSNINP
ncbi:type II secretion system protein [Candidatus Roizmanbacteria bacterium]|nr:type II secretion system protein [Candidatus Roizmanbacteria bacterium]